MKNGSYMLRSNNICFDFLVETQIGYGLYSYPDNVYRRNL